MNFKDFAVRFIRTTKIQRKPEGAIFLNEKFVIFAFYLKCSI